MVYRRLELCKVGTRRSQASMSAKAVASSCGGSRAIILFQARRSDVRMSDLRRGAERVMRESAERRSHDLPWRANREAVARRMSDRRAQLTDSTSPTA